MTYEEYEELVSSLFPAVEEYLTGHKLGNIYIYCEMSTWGNPVVELHNYETSTHLKFWVKLQSTKSAKTQLKKKLLSALDFMKDD